MFAAPRGDANDISRLGHFIGKVEKDVGLPILGGGTGGGKCHVVLGSGTCWAWVYDDRGIVFVLMLRLLYLHLLLLLLLLRCSIMDVKSINIKLNANDEPSNYDEEHDCHCQRCRNFCHLGPIPLHPPMVTAAADINDDIAASTDDATAPATATKDLAGWRMHYAKYYLMVIGLRGVRSGRPRLILIQPN